MLYKEYIPDSYFSKHVESYWEIFTNSCDKVTSAIMPPEGVFDILFINTPIFLKYSKDDSNKWIRINNGAFFMGLLTQSVSLRLEKNTNVFGIRLKPFSLAKLINKPLHIYTNKIDRLQEVFNNVDQKIINGIIYSESINSKIKYVELFISGIIDKSIEINQEIREILNNIMDNKGDIKISKLYIEYNTNKFTLRNHFLNNVGLSPKEISKIWRLNNFLKLRKEFPAENLTSSGYDAGYYDQSHLIKDFKSYFNSSPFQLLNTNNKYLLKYSQERITRRFASYYSPF
ncbi:DUF6597 domain-containing transcriptional factor [Bacteroidota bacterium]